MISVRIWSSSVPYFPAFGLYTERYGVPFNPNAENVDQKNSEYGHFSRSVKTIVTIEYFSFWKKSLLWLLSGSFSWFLSDFSLLQLVLE